MAEYRNDTVPPTSGANKAPGSVNTTFNTPPTKESSNTVYFLIGGLIVAVGVLWFAFSDRMGTTTTPAAAPGVRIENTTTTTPPPAAATPAPVAPPVTPPTAPPPAADPVTPPVTSPVTPPVQGN